MRRRRTATGVALVVHPGSELYGSDRMMCESVTALVDAGLQVHVALPARGPLVAEVERRGATCQVMTMPVLRKAGLRPAGFARLAATALRSSGPTVGILRRLRPDVVYVSTQILPSWLLAARLVGAVTVCHVHEAERHPSRFVTAGLVAPLRLADGIIVNSRFAADTLVGCQASLKDRISVVYNGVRGPVRAVPPRSKLTDPVRLAYVGRLSPRKGPDVAAAATRLLRDSGMQVRLDLLGGVFAGYEWFEEQLRREFADLVADGSLRFRGFSESVWPTLEECDIALVPSTAPEPFGNTAVEATLAARPAVVSRSGGLPEAVAGTDSVVLVPPSEPDALAGAVRSVVDRWPSYAAAARAGASSAQERFSPSRYRRELADVVLAAMSSHSSGET